MRARHALLLATATLIAPPASLGAQRFPSFGGAGVGIMLSDPVNRNGTTSWFVDADLGHVWQRNFRLLLGAEQFRMDRTGDVGGAPRFGHLSALGARARMRFDPLETGRLAPYVALGAVFLDVRTKIPAGVHRWPRPGTRSGGSIAFGTRFTLDAAGRTALTADADRVFVGDLTHWTAALGVRYMAMGRRAYEAPRKPVVTEDPRLRLQRDAARMAEWVRRELERMRRDSTRACPPPDTTGAPAPEGA
jgi:hypothetical protein